MQDATAYSIEKTKTTPAMAWSISDSGIHISITGESYPENAVGFYEKMFVWLKHAFGLPERIPFSMTLALTYCNTSSAKVLVDIAELLQHHYLTSSRNIAVVFRVQEDDEGMLEMAEEMFCDWDTERYTIERFE
jgi:hypothetical protein